MANSSGGEAWFYCVRSNKSSASNFHPCNMLKDSITELWRDNEGECLHTSTVGFLGVAGVDMTLS